MSRAMKPSGIEWIGEIPEGWKLLRIKSICKSISSGLSISSDLINTIGLYPVYGGNGIMGYVNEYNSDENDIIIGRVGAKCGNIYLVSGKKWISDNALILVINDGKNDFFYYLLKALDLNRLSSHNAQPLITGSMVLNQNIPLPPLPEQQAIADYLDRKCELIDNTIEKQKTAIEKLKLYKQSVITEAVTKGLDPTVPMKPSGIEWIGDIPDGWEVKKGKHIFKIYGSNNSETFENDFLEIPYFKVDSLNMVKDNFFVSAAPENLKVKKFTSSIKAPIILIPKRGAAIYTNKVRIVMIDCLFDSNIMALRPIKDNIKFLSYVIFCRKLTDIGDVSTIPQINNKHIWTLDIPLPPLPEQQAIEDYLDQKCSQIDQAIELKQKLIEKLSNYKKSLIYECVTGKREVGAS